jgi:ABC-type glycerol-3-phosphate transport system substrate-binding protein
MKTFNVLVLVLVLASLVVVATSGVAYAGPEVTITVKNNSEFAANYDAVSSSAYTYGQANPKPPVQIAPGSSDFSKLKELYPLISLLRSSNTR